MTTIKELYQEVERLNVSKEFLIAQLVENKHNLKKYNGLKPYF